MVGYDSGSVDAADVCVVGAADDVGVGGAAETSGFVGAVGDDAAAVEVGHHREHWVLHTTACQ
jgi:hypothetical protein